MGITDDRKFITIVSKQQVQLFRVVTPSKQLWKHCSSQHNNETRQCIQTIHAVDQTIRYTSGVYTESSRR